MKWGWLGPHWLGLQQNDNEIQLSLLDDKKNNILFAIFVTYLLNSAMTTLLLYFSGDTVTMRQGCYKLKSDVSVSSLSLVIVAMDSFTRISLIYQTSKPKTGSDFKQTLRLI